MNNSSTPPPGIDDPPRLPPKDSPAVTAPTPTTTPFTWVVPETALVLEALLSLIYPRGTFTSSPEALLTSLELTGRVIRAALGYQSAKALTIARDRMSDFVESSPVDVYAMASFFKFTDLAKLASQRALRVPISSWTNDSRLLMSKTALSRLEELQESRLAGLHGILGRSLEMDEHSAGCVRRGMIEEVWKRKVEQVERTLTPDSELIELLNIDLRGGHCGDCLVQLGKTIQSCLYEAREMPRSI